MKEGEGGILDNTENERIHLLLRLKYLEKEFHKKYMKTVKQLCDLEDREVLNVDRDKKKVGI